MAGWRASVVAAGKTKTRRKRVRKRRAEATASWWERFRGAVGLWPAFAAVVFVVLAVAIALYGTQSVNYAIGQKVDQPITARVDFRWVNDAETQQNRQEARSAAPSHYVTNQKLIDEICLSIRTVYQDAKAESFEAFAEAARSHGWAPGEALEELYRELQARMSEEDSQAYAGWVEGLGRRLRGRYTYRPAASEGRQPAATGPEVRVVSKDAKQPDEAPIEPVEVLTIHLAPVSSSTLVADMAVGLAGEFPLPVLRQAVRGLLVERLSAEPLLLYDKALTEEVMQQAADAVEPAVISFERGQPIVSPRGGEAAVLDDVDLALLETEEVQYQSLLAGDDAAAAPLRTQVYLEQAGTAAVMVLLSLALFWFLGLYQRRILEVRTRTIAFASLVLGLLLCARLIDLHWSLQEFILFPAVIAAACLTIAYPRPFALGAMGIASLLVVQAVRGGMELLVVLLTAEAVTVHLLHDIRTRTQIISSGVLTAALVFVVGFAFGLIDKQAVGYAVVRAGFGGGSTLAAALVVQGLLPFIERAFRIATSLTLLEWSSADKPALQRLAREAPGTYNHSLVLGTMGQAACEAIGANGLLVRVGALYHDLGKIHKADYFAENQEASISRHDNLAASMSLLIILGHVKDGIELAREYGLPRVLYPFIEEHHGTTVVRYFHYKASEKQPQIASGRHDREISEAEFRYPGPRPRSKESAVLMICDGVEGSVRSLAEPTVGRIESVVHQTVIDRLNDGQFGECDITLKDLQTVEDSVVKSLSTFYHGRVSYPKGPPPKGQAPPRDEEQGPPAKEASPPGGPEASEPGGQEDTATERRQPA